MLSQPGGPLTASVPELDPTAEPEGFVVEVAPGDRIHFLDWGGPEAPPAAAPDGSSHVAGPAPGVLLIHGLGQTAWTWAPVARRLRRVRRVVAMDLRGHGLSDAPTWGYEPDAIVEDVIAAAEGSGLTRPVASGATADDEPDRPIILAGHGFGACVAGWAAAAMGERCAGLVLVDGGWENLRAASGMEPDEWLRGLDEPPEVLRSMQAYLADRAGFDPATWDADQERAARATVVEVPAGRVVSSVRPHALAGTVEAMFDYRPSEVLITVSAPIVVLTAADNDEGTRAADLVDLQRVLAAAGRPAMRTIGFPGAGHNLMRYHPVEVTGAILAVAARSASPGTIPS